jgi:hypothetical protein
MGSEREVRATVRTQAIHGNGTIAQLPVPIEIACRSGEDDLVIAL